MIPLAPSTLAELRAAVGLRNVLVHEYVRVDLHRVSAAADRAPGVFGTFIRQVGRWVERQEEQ